MKTQLSFTKISARTIDVSTKYTGSSFPPVYFLFAFFLPDQENMKLITKRRDAK